ncbi:sensor histidine kinase [Brevibacterium linens]|uniref:sensor histidine kinase n=1 Tax=Brevibacterium linens TaxID=1703 RepID=UPI00197AF883|nr:histidine kinase [Brevibacterium linens]
MHRSTDWARSAAYVLVIASLTVLAASGMNGWPQVILIGLAALGAAAALVREEYPYALLVVAWATTAFATQVLLIPALFNLGVRRKGRRGLLAIALTFVLLGVVAARGERLVSVDGVDLEAWTSVGSWLLNSIVVVLVPYLIGTAVAARRDLTDSYRIRAEHAEAERSARAAEAVLLERARIAREAHDVLGHKLSLLTMQAGGLELNAHAGGEVVEKQAQLIRRSARAALDDLRSIIGSIETPDWLDSEATERSLVPQDILGIEKLITESRSSGAIVDLVSSDLTTPEMLPEKTTRAAYRIVQEGLTNAHRHAPSAPVIVSLAGSPGQHLVIEVRNAVTDPVSETERPGHGGRGLPGLQERARTVGGELTVTESDSVFIVRADLPWPAADTDQTEASG